MNLKVAPLWRQQNVDITPVGSRVWDDTAVCLLKVTLVIFEIFHFPQINEGNNGSSVEAIM